MSDDMQSFLSAFDGVKGNLNKIEELLGRSPDLVGSLCVDDYFLLLDLSRVYSYHHA